mgnify:CR=1 FL=1
MLEAIEYTAMVLSPVFLGAIGYLIVLIVFEYFINPYRVFRKRGPRVFRRTNRWENTKLLELCIQNL